LLPAVRNLGTRYTNLRCQKLQLNPAPSLLPLIILCLLLLTITSWCIIGLSIFLFSFVI
jgi:hypothetical protein